MLLNYRDCLELDLEAGLLRIKDAQHRWNIYHKGGTYEATSSSVSPPPLSKCCRTAA